MERIHFLSLISLGFRRFLSGALNSKTGINHEF